MGVYIKGMEKPESCHDCVFNYDWQECMAKAGNGDELWDFTKHSAPVVYSTCPLQLIDDEKVEKTKQELIEAFAIYRQFFRDEKNER